VDGQYRALWRVIKHKSASVSSQEYLPMLRQARWLLRVHPDLMLLAQRGFANHALLNYWR